MEDGRDGGNPDFDGDVQDQYQGEVGLAVESSLAGLAGGPHDEEAPAECLQGRGRDVHHQEETGV